MKANGWMAALRTALFSIGVVALSWLLVKFGSAYQTLVLVGIFSAGVLLLIEAAILHRKIRHGQRERERLRPEGSKSFEEGTEGDRLEHWLRVTRPREDWFWRVGTSLLLVASFGFISVSCYPSSRLENGQMTVQFSDQIEEALVKRLATNSTPPGAGPVTINSTLKLDPKLEAALLEYLRKPAASNGGMPWRSILIFILVAAAVVGLIWWAVSGEPEATPLKGALATLAATGAVLEKLVKAGHAPPVSCTPWLAILVSLALIAAAIAFTVAGYLRLTMNKDKISINKESLLGAALLVFGFSAAFLAIVPPLLFHAESVPPKPVTCPQCPSPTAVMPTGGISVLPLGAVDNFKGETADESKIQQLTALVAKKAGEGDILWLLGSADCIPTRPRNEGGRWDNNEELAKARANWVRDRLLNEQPDQPAVRGIGIEPRALPQHARCGPASNLRAVYPFLVQAKKSPADNSRP